MAVDSTELSKEEFDAAYPVGSERRREELAVNPRPQDEQEGQSGAEVSEDELAEFRAWKAGREESPDGS